MAEDIGLCKASFGSFKPNWAETAPLALAARMCGIVINPIPPIYRESELAFILGALAHRLRLSPLVGYLLAGVVAGPFTPGFVGDAELAPAR